MHREGTNPTVAELIEADRVILTRLAEGYELLWEDGSACLSKPGRSAVRVATMHLPFLVERGLVVETRPGPARRYEITEAGRGALSLAVSL